MVLNRVLITDSISPEGEEALATQVEVVRAPNSDPDTVRRLARDIDGVIIRSKLPDDIFAVAPKLRAVVIHGTGVDLVPLSAAAARGAVVANLPGVNARSVAEYCAMAMLVLARNIVPIVASLRAGTWDEARALGAAVHEIAGMTLGIVGVGEIGRRLAGIAGPGLRMRVLGYRRRMDRLPADVEPCPLERLLRESDFVIVTCPLTPETHHLFNAGRIGLMKRTAWLVNVGRGPVVDEIALVEALRERRIAGAMLDVYERYRLEPDNDLFTLENVILTPHLAGMTIESRARMGVAAAEEMLRILAGQSPTNRVHADQ